MSDRHHQPAPTNQDRARQALRRMNARSAPGSSDTANDLPNPVNQLTLPLLDNTPQSSNPHTNQSTRTTPESPVSPSSELSSLPDSPAVTHTIFQAVNVTQRPQFSDPSTRASDPSGESPSKTAKTNHGQINTDDYQTGIGRQMDTEVLAADKALDMYQQQLLKIREQVASQSLLNAHTKPTSITNQEEIPEASSSCCQALEPNLPARKVTASSRTSNTPGTQRSKNKTPKLPANKVSNTNTRDPIQAQTLVNSIEASTSSDQPTKLALAPSYIVELPKIQATASSHTSNTPGTQRSKNKTPKLPANRVLNTNTYYPIQAQTLVDSIEASTSSDQPIKLALAPSYIAELPKIQATASSRTSNTPGTQRRKNKTPKLPANKVSNTNTCDPIRAQTLVDSIEASTSSDQPIKLALAPSYIAELPKIQATASSHTSNTPGTQRINSIEASTSSDPPIKLALAPSYIAELPKIHRDGTTKTIPVKKNIPSPVNVFMPNTVRSHTIQSLLLPGLAPSFKFISAVANQDHVSGDQKNSETPSLTPACFLISPTEHVERGSSSNVAESYPDLIVFSPTDYMGVYFQSNSPQSSPEGELNKTAKFDDGPQAQLASPNDINQALVDSVPTSHQERLLLLTHLHVTCQPTTASKTQMTRPENFPPSLSSSKQEILLAQLVEAQLIPRADPRSAPPGPLQSLPVLRERSPILDPIELRYQPSAFISSYNVPH
ncbi:hypothetical protein PSHT_08830 [Puccinia striiformis]|uniref:Uncharacterized protein n=1 Tax=Puccinia striiformis TaxID=27350 RepID=A0A2S4VLN2_9BASI|nr:hypothetical protein PSHT_08830 [Puccinia striiformis]